jgi:hypothetical protein
VASGLHRPVLTPPPTTANHCTLQSNTILRTILRPLAFGLWLLVFNLVYPCPWALAESPVIRNAISQPGSSFVRKNGVAGMKFSAPPHASPTAYQQTAALGGPKRELRGQILVDSWTIHKSKHVAYMVVTRSRGELGRSSVCVSNVRSPTAQC